MENEVFGKHKENELNKMGSMRIERFARIAEEKRISEKASLVACVLGQDLGKGEAHRYVYSDERFRIENRFCGALRVIGSLTYPVVEVVFNGEQVYFEEQKELVLYHKSVWWENRLNDLYKRAKKERDEKRA